MARIKIETIVPAGTEVAYARADARVKAAEALNMHIVEETLLPFPDKRAVPGNVNAEGFTETVLEDIPNNSSSDRKLTTWWDIG